MRSLSVNLVGPTTLFSSRECSLKWRLLDEKEYDHGIHWGHQQPSPERDVQVEVPAMELLTHESTWKEIMPLYHQAYQLKRNLGEVPCSQDTAEETHIEILDDRC